MTQDARNDCLLGDGGHDPERAAVAEEKVARLPPPTQWRKTGGHIQVKHAPQQSCPAPVRCPRGASCPSTPCWRGVGMIAPRR
jgi:hypothetical protein